MDGNEREREGKGQERREEVAGDLIRARGGSGWTALASGGGGATGSVATGREVEDDPGFATTPLGLFFFFYSGPFSFLFSVYYLKHAVKQLFEGPNNFRKM